MTNVEDFPKRAAVMEVWITAGGCLSLRSSQQSLTRARLNRPRIRTVRLPMADGNEAQAPDGYARQPQARRCLEERMGEGEERPRGLA